MKEKDCKCYRMGFHDMEAHKRGIECECDCHSAPCKHEGTVWKSTGLWCADCGVPLDNEAKGLNDDGTKE